MIPDATFRNRLRGLLSGEVLFDEPAEHHTSLGVGGPIDALVFPGTEEELPALVRFLNQTEIPYLPVGNWTNLVVTDRGYRGVLIALKGLAALRAQESGEERVRIEAQAGVPLAQLVQFSQTEALTGLEFAAGIPGSLGGALRMNAGAYGGEIKDVVVSLWLVDPDGTVRTEAREMIHFDYRSLDLPPKSIIIGAVLRLRRGDRTAVATRIQEILAARREKHPLTLRNAGSVFKNLKDIPAGRLIEAAGLKGLRIGDAQVSEKHANFIVNRGAATATDILQLIDLVQERVMAATGYRLETEVKVIGA